MLTVACVQTGNYCRRGREYVRILRNAVSRNLSEPHEFVCFTDDPIPGAKDIRFEKIETDLGGWWNKVRLFQNCTNGTTLFLDLDTIITGPLDEVARLDTSFAALQDFYRPNGLGSGVMLWKGDHSDIWRTWKRSGKPKLPGGDQQWIEMTRPLADRLQDLVPGKICSFKPNGQWLTAIPDGVSICAFHGSPKPHDVGWVKERYWHV